MKIIDIIQNLMFSAAFLSAGSIVHASIVTDWVWIGDIGNAPDTTGLGGVSYSYLISRYEVTNLQYCEFLNCVAKTDTYELYSPNMEQEYGGIVRKGTQGDYSYSVRVGRGMMPVNYVELYDAYRYANWLHNGQPSGFQDDSTTEMGSYNMSSPAPNYSRMEDATVVIPTENEWYKAAYYKGGGTNAGYWLYATQSDLAPTAQGPENGTVNSANYNWGVGDLTQVGAYVQSMSAYGTYDQNGNVWEYFQGFIRYPIFPGIRGGALHYEYGLRSDEFGDMNGDSFVTGFRVALVPEPTIFVFLGFGYCLMSIRRCHRIND
ncbi:MAG: formylglycine-generating enzyme family protein [Phycisphaerae bacterium]|nr:formylglycine-generating enzyme family protein [Phycisphaerae bacterium]